MLLLCIYCKCSAKTYAQNYTHFTHPGMWTFSVISVDMSTEMTTPLPTMTSSRQGSALHLSIKGDLFFQSYNEFHSDLFPETANGEPALTAQQWFVGQDSAVPMVQVQPTGSLIKWERRGFLFSDSKEAPDSKKGNAEMPQSTSSVSFKIKCF